MKLGSTLGNALLATRAYHNWAEVVFLLARQQEPTRIVLKNGQQITGATGLCSQVRKIFFEEIYTPAPLSIEQNDIVVDIGAGYGVFSLFASTYTQNTIYAFEPTPKSFTLLQQNISYLPQVTTHRCAISHKIGSSLLLLDPDDGQYNRLPILHKSEPVHYYFTPHFTDVHPTQSRLDLTLTIPTLTISAILEHYQLEQIDFLKMSCEGAEGTIIHSMSQQTLEKVRKLAFSFHDHLSPYPHQELQSFLSRAGFTTLLDWDRCSPQGYLYGWRAS
ncbi:FkbM family methyltransferase [Tengunoibacter tsumagoiensis]|uniref:FkbM family methyltransferase n=1 Tax=Tengunoibacter tsumagoiensis TaxID=2014871 RepID=A0A402A634_9CHLR|nr:FkbM family methyltransferase [Tengunoibacter tsumagoiensis]GCE14598.1 FkbM family methyltransferase [Tengunoibacter tsumagoiensis]